MTRLEGIVSRFFYDPEKSSAIFRMRGDGRTYSVKVPESWRDYDDFVMTRPGDKVTIDIEVNDMLDTWYNDTSATSLDGTVGHASAAARPGRFMKPGHGPTVRLSVPGGS